MTKDQLLSILSSVSDPEIPVITIAELGILRDVEINEDKVKIYITPTYNGCPAMDMISVNIKASLQDHGIVDVDIISLLQPAWTTDWMTESGKKKLMDFGISPPSEMTTDSSFIMGNKPRVICPLCKSTNTILISRFGSTACKSLYKCQDCLEPFDYFKCH